MGTFIALVRYVSKVIEVLCVVDWGGLGCCG